MVTLNKFTKKNNKYIQLFIALVVLGVFLGGVFALTRTSTEVAQNYFDIGHVKIGKTTLNVETVTTPEAKAQGLSGRKGLADNAGMLFVFEKLGKYHFWMKDMQFSIDMIWIDDNSVVTYIKKDAKPNSYPQVFGGEEDSRYVLEVVSGFSEKNNIKVGDTVEFLR